MSLGIPKDKTLLHAAMQLQILQQPNMLEIPKDHVGITNRHGNTNKGGY
jgi:hypothetical protein